MPTSRPGESHNFPEQDFWLASLFNLAIDVIDRVPKLQATAAHTKEWLKDQIVNGVNYVHESGIDRQHVLLCVDLHCVQAYDFPQR